MPKSKDLSNEVFGGTIVQVGYLKCKSWSITKCIELLTKNIVIGVSDIRFLLRKEKLWNDTKNKPMKNLKQHKI